MKRVVAGPCKIITLPHIWTTPKITVIYFFYLSLYFSLIVHVTWETSTQIIFIVNECYIERRADSSIYGSNYNFLSLLWMSSMLHRRRANSSIYGTNYNYLGVWCLPDGAFRVIDYKRMWKFQSITELTPIVLTKMLTLFYFIYLRQ